MRPELVRSADDPAGAEVGVNVNRLLPFGPGSYETYSNMAFMVGIPVEVIPASTPRTRAGR